MATLTEAQAGFLRWARVARLATVAPDGTPHVVPVCPVPDGEEVVVALESGSVKLRNARFKPEVALVVDEYREDWGSNAGLLIRGRVRFLEGKEWERARGLLYEKFSQYEPLAPIEDDAIVSVSVAHVASWGL